MKRVKRERLKVALVQVAALLTAGCSRSPAQDMFGSFFPGWMLCAGAGIVAAVIARQLLSAIGADLYLIAPPLTYLCIAIAGTLLAWLLWFGD
ncbi:MAG: hypothetical protein JO110_00880 [Acetobacteraceae bacterium]|nr:hypothetical protein [Acetobacteraceae bacterium]